ncbi:MAG: HAMP domain-containing protein, partial [Maritimibacter sp.]
MKAIRLRKLRVPRVNSIFVKLAAFVAIVAAALSASISYEFTQSGMRVAKHQLSKTAAQVNTMQADALGDALHAGDLDAITTAIDFLTAQTEAQMLEAVIVAPDGEVLLDYGVDDTHGEELAVLARQAIEDDWETVSEDGFSVAKTVVYGEDWETVGALATRWTIDAVAAEAWQENMRAIQVAVIVALIAIALSVLILRFWISKPMVALSRVVDKVSQEQYDVAVPSAKRGDELGDIGKSVVRLRDQLSAGIARITQNRFRGAAFEASGAAMMMVDDALKITQINRAGIALFSENRDNFRSVAADFDPDQIIGYDVASFHPRLSASELSELLSDPENLPYEDEIGVGDLRLRLAISAVRDEHGASIGYVVEWMDETEEYLNRAVMGALDKSQIRADFSAEGELLSGNEIVQKAWNITEDQMSSMPPLQDVSEPLYREMQKGNVVYDVFPGPVRSDGEQVLTDGAFAPVMDEQGKLMRIVLIGQDVTDARKA